VKNIAFIDLEASGLGASSWPIEVGWCFPDSAPETYLIRPSEDWSPAAWDENAEALHGVTLEMLQKEGADMIDVCKCLNEALARADVFSDAPDWDAFWLYRLYSAAGEKQAFKLNDFGDLLQTYAPEKVADAMARAADKAPHRHRAHDDVLHMKTVYKFASGC